MFEEFSVRLQDPEWQVRQHALRVLYDVLAVLNAKSDMYMPPIIPKLVENLGHPAPTVRKGALDSLRMYLAETAHPENVILQILDIGLNQRISNEPYGGRMTCGVLLSLPALIQSTLHTKKRNYILRTTIDMLVNKMTHVTHQEITLKVLTKLKELIGPREFSEYMSHAAFREYELLCSVYGVGEKRHMHQSEPKVQLNSSRSSWKLMSSSFDSDDPKESDGYWRSSDEERTLNYTFTKLPSITPPLVEKSAPSTMQPEKIIMETEIKINNDTVTMRILEEGDKYESSTDDDYISRSVVEPTGLVQVFTDSEVDDGLTPKRVTFGGEVVKMRTPDSDASHEEVVKSEVKQKEKSFDLLTIEITNDNTKSPPIMSPSQGTQTSPPPSPSKQSPRSPFKRLSIASVDSIVSPKTQHKEIEVLHNLQRDPSPNRSTPKRSAETTPTKEPSPPPTKGPSPPPKNWEELGIVSENVLKNLKSG
uniref:TOG domain-containing protein n=1 Tax=Megaselia scalaris TaxID=36166 RepID=T1GH23_MEGSC